MADVVKEAEPHAAMIEGLRVGELEKKIDARIALLEEARRTER